MKRFSFGLILACLLLLKVFISPASAFDAAACGQALAKYTNDLCTALATYPNTANIKLLTPAWNGTSFTFGDLTGAYKNAGANLACLDGVAANLYNISGLRIANLLPNVTAQFPGMPIYLTEIGTQDTGPQGITNLAADVAAIRSRVQASLLFNAFGTNPDSRFGYAVMSDSQIQTICNGNCSAAKIGINSAAGFAQNSGYYNRAKGLGMTFNLEIANSGGVSAAATGINSAWGMRTIIRIGVGDDSGGFDNPATYAKFLSDVSSGVGGKEFYAIAGPNEPGDECWIDPSCCLNANDPGGTGFVPPLSCLPVNQDDLPGIDCGGVFPNGSPIMLNFTSQTRSSHPDHADADPISCNENPVPTSCSTDPVECQNCLRTPGGTSCYSSSNPQSCGNCCGCVNLPYEGEIRVNGLDIPFADNLNNYFTGINDFEHLQARGIVRDVGKGRGLTREQEIYDSGIFPRLTYRHLQDALKRQAAHEIQDKIDCPDRSDPDCFSRYWDFRLNMWTKAFCSGSIAYRYGEIGRKFDGTSLEGPLNQAEINRARFDWFQMPYFTNEESRGIIYFTGNDAYGSLDTSIPEVMRLARSTSWIGAMLSPRHPGLFPVPYSPTYQTTCGGTLGDLPSSADKTLLASTQLFSPPTDLNYNFVNPVFAQTYDCNNPFGASVGGVTYDGSFLYYTLHLSVTPGDGRQCHIRINNHFNGQCISPDNGWHLSSGDPYGLLPNVPTSGDGTYNISVDVCIDAHYPCGNVCQTVGCQVVIKGGVIVSTTCGPGVTQPPPFCPKSFCPIPLSCTKAAQSGPPQSACCTDVIDQVYPNLHGLWQYQACGQDILSEETICTDQEFEDGNDADCSSYFAAGIVPACSEKCVLHESCAECHSCVGGTPPEWDPNLYCNGNRFDCEEGCGGIWNEESCLTYNVRKETGPYTANHQVALNVDNQVPYLETIFQRNVSAGSPDWPGGYYREFFPRPNAGTGPFYSTLSDVFQPLPAEDFCTYSVNVPGYSRTTSHTAHGCTPEDPDSTEPFPTFSGYSSSGNLRLLFYRLATTFNVKNFFSQQTLMPSKLSI